MLRLVSDNYSNVNKVSQHHKIIASNRESTMRGLLILGDADNVGKTAPHLRIHQRIVEHKNSEIGKHLFTVHGNKCPLIACSQVVDIVVIAKDGSLDAMFPFQLTVVLSRIDTFVPGISYYFVT